MNSNIDNERAVIGGIIADGLAGCLADEAFFQLADISWEDRESGEAFALLVDLYSNKEEIGPVSFIERLKRNGTGRQEATTLVQSFITSATYPEAAKQYVSAIRRAYFNREIERELLELKQLGQEAPSEKIERIMSLMDQREQNNKQSILRAADIADGYLASLENPSRMKLNTGFPTLDENLHAQPGDLIVIGARTGVGKTTFMTNVLYTMLRENINCLYIPTEMKPSQFTGRLLPLMTNVPASRFRSHDMTEDHLTQIREAMERYKKLPLRLMDIASPSITEIRRGVKASSCQVLFVDYLGRCSMKAEKNDTRARAIEKFIVELKTLCVEQGIICFLAVQLGRLVDRNEGSPTLADLADSSAIEKEADLVLLLWKDPGKMSGAMGRGVITATIAKNRHGYLRLFDLDFDKEKMQLSEQVYIPATYNGRDE